jgi:hypothetical protein
MKEQLVEMTGLNPRVIRVWFQNKRCKDKKKNMLRPEHPLQHPHQHLNQQQQQQHHHLHQHQFGNAMGSHLQQSAGPYNPAGVANGHLMFDHCF